MRKLQRDSYELCSATKPIRIESFHDQFRYSPEQVFLGSVLLRQMPDSLLGWGQRTGWHLGRVRQPLRMYDVIILLKTSTFTCGDAPD